MRVYAPQEHEEDAALEQGRGQGAPDEAPLPASARGVAGATSSGRSRPEQWS
jgi:hypothetical protein